MRVFNEFYELYANQIREPAPPQEPPTKGKVVIRIPCRVAFLEFRDGVCLWTASGNKHHVLYRTNHEWELWSARQQEIQELREEQSAKERLSFRLLEVEDHHLTRKTDDAIKAGAYADAAACVAARMDLRIKSKGINGISCLWLRCPLLPWLDICPISHFKLWNRVFTETRFYATRFCTLCQLVCRPSSLASRSMRRANQTDLRRGNDAVSK